MEKRDVNLIPFRAIFISNGKIDLAEIILNVVIFVPLGIYAGVLFKRWSFEKNFSSFSYLAWSLRSLSSFFKIGAFDVTDIITNTIGGIIGLLMFTAIEKTGKQQ
jgi:glycopeptide antibiotics resistance protein